MAQRIDPAVLGSVCDVMSASISPDGNHVVYARRSFFIRESTNVTSSLWMAEVGKPRSSKQLTQGKFNDYSPQFSPDGSYISFVSDRTGPGKGSGLYLLPLRGGEPFLLTPENNEMGVGDYKWRPDGKVIAFASADEKSEARKQKEQNGSGAVVQDEFVDLAKMRILQVETKEVTNLVSAEGTVGQIAWNDKGTEIVYTTFEGPSIESWVVFGSDVHLIDVEKNTSRQLCHFHSYIYGQLAWHNDEILWPGHYKHGVDTTSRAIWSISATEKEAKYKYVAHGETECATDVRSRDTEKIIKTREGLADVIKTQSGKELYREKHDLQTWDVHVSSAQITVAVGHGVIGTPPEIYSVVNGNKVQLSEHGRDIADMKIGKSHLCEYTHDDGTPIDGLYGVPSSIETSFANGKPSPTIVIVRGGPYLRSTDSFDIFFQVVPFFISLGYLVLLPNYRGGSGHGHSYANAVYGDCSQSYQDVIWLIKKGIEEGRVDKDHVGLVGWSMGGYLANLAATRDADFHFAAIVAGAGMSDWATMAQVTDIPSWVAEMSGTLPWQSDDINNVQQRKCSPLYHMQDVQSPVLLIHGEDDWRVGKEQSIAFYRGLKARGKEVTLVLYRGEGHGWPLPWEKKNSKDMVERMEKFFDEHVRKGVNNDNQP